MHPRPAPSLTAPGRIEAQRETGGEVERGTGDVALSCASAPDDLPTVVRVHCDIGNGPCRSLDVVFHEGMATGTWHDPAKITLTQPRELAPPCS